MSDRTYYIVRAGGKTYFGDCKFSNNSQIQEALLLKNAVELITLTGVTPVGLQKQVVLTGIDYCTSPLAEIYIPLPDALYDIELLDGKDRKALMDDYQNFRDKDNLVKVPQMSPVKKVQA